ncbi:MAG: ABC transporter substrate-binding protein [Gammaproteobacteria bacterium]
MAMLLMMASANGTEAGLPVVRVALDLWPGYYPVVIAQKQGYFAKRGLQVDYTIPENTDQMLEAFAAGKVDVVCVALGDVFAFRERVPSLRVVMLSDESAGGDALVSLKPLPQTLKGLRVGTNLNGFGELFVRAFVRQQNASLKDIVLVNQEASKAAVMLSEGKVDVAHTLGAIRIRIDQLQRCNGCFYSERTPGLIPDAVVMHGNLLQQPERARAFVAAWLEAAEWWLTHRHAGNRIAERALLLMPNTVNLEGIRPFDGSSKSCRFPEERE